MFPTGLLCPRPIYRAKHTPTSGLYFRSHPLELSRSVPVFYSGPPCCGFYFDSDRQQRAWVVYSRNGKGKGFGRKDDVLRNNPSKSGTSDWTDAPDENVVRKPQDQSRDEDDQIPEIVTDRMLRRISLGAGIPLAIGVLFFPVFKALKEMNVYYPPSLPILAFMTTACASGLGFAYAVISTSWDPSREGSLLGWEEAQFNWPLLGQKGQDKEEKK